jgi:hypothetical protein
VDVSKYFLIVGDGDVRDISFRKKHRSSDGSLVWYRLYVGEEQWGMVAKLDDRSGWSASSWNWPEGYEMRSIEQTIADEQDQSARPDLALLHVPGFITRMAAATYIIKHHGYWKRT